MALHFLPLCVKIKDSFFCLRTAMSSIPLVTTDPAVMRLAHPLRCAAAQSDFLPVLQNFFGPYTWSCLQTAFCDSTKMTTAAIIELCESPRHQRLKKMVQHSAQMTGGTELGNAYASLIFVRHALAPQPYFVIDDALVELLEQTDIARDIPLSMLNLPYPRFFLEFGKLRQNGLAVPNTETGNHVLEGAYCEYGKHPQKGEGLFVLLTGSPLGKSNAMDDATYSVFLSFRNRDLTLEEALNDAFASGTQAAQQMGLRPPTAALKGPGLGLMLFLAKVLLYIGLPEARRTIHNDRAAWAKETAGLQSAAKRAKAQKRARGLTDHVLISAPPPSATSAFTPSETGRTVRSHWRRGHYRLQPHGPQLSLKRLVFIRPTLVHSATGDAPVSEYLVT